MGDIIITSLVGLFCTTFSSVVTFFLTKRKYSAEVESQQIKNIDESVEIYKKMMEENLRIQDKRIKTLEEENSNLKQQVTSLQLQIIEIMKIKVENISSIKKRSRKNGNTNSQKVQEK